MISKLLKFFKDNMEKFKKEKYTQLELDFTETEESDEIPQHVIDEAAADAARQRTRDLRQMEMYDDEWMNWSGLR